MSTKTSDSSRFPTNSGGWVIDQDQTELRRLTLRQGMLDELLRHGGLALPPPKSSSDGLILMLRGKAGTGKSTLALQLAANLSLPPGVKAQRSPDREFLSLEQDRMELRAIFGRIVAEQESAQMKLSQGVSPSPQAIADPAKEGEKPKRAAKGSRGEGQAQTRGVARQPDRHAGLEPVHCPDGALIWFNSDEHPQPQLREDPLSRAHSFVKSFPASVNRRARPILFIDGLSILSEENRVRLEMAALVESLRQRCLIGVIAYEPSRGVEESLDHQVDMVIELEEKHLSNPIDYVLHELHFKKSRYQEAALGWHQYKIRSYGLEIYPSVHFQVHSHLYMTSQLVGSLTPVQQKRAEGGKGLPDKHETPVEQGWSVIEQVLGGIKPGDSIALLGPRGAFKTALTLDFLFRSHPYRDGTGCRPAKAQPFKFSEAQHGLLVSVIDNEDTLRVHKTCPMANERVKPCGCFGECCKHAFLFYQRPGCIASAEFLYYLKTRLQVAKTPIRRLAFWDLTQLEHRFPLLANDPMFVPALLDLFKIKMRAPESEPERRVKSVFMGAANARLSTTIAAVADNVIFCWRDRVKPEQLDTPEMRSAIARIWSQTGRTGRDYLMVYVDRTSGGFAQERKSLHAFPIFKGYQLFVPGGAWKSADYAIPSDLIPSFEYSEGQIRHVTEMQGFKSEPTPAHRGEVDQPATQLVNATKG